MDRIDYKRVFKECYGARAGQVTLVDVPPIQFLLLDGRGERDTAPFQQGAEALVALAKSLNAIIRKGPMALNFTLMPLEVLWQNGDGPLHWTLMIMQPPVVDRSLVERARDALVRKIAAPLVAQVRLARIDEGKAVQTLHLETENKAEALARLQAFAAAQSYRTEGTVHEIYLSDPRRTAPEKRKILLRQTIVRQE